MIARNIVAALALSLSLPALSAAQTDAQTEGPQPTQALITVTSKGAETVNPADVAINLNNKSADITSITPLAPGQTQVAILLDDGLRTSVARQLDDIRNFIKGLPVGTEVFVGYMQNGRVAPAQNFTANLPAAAAALRIPFGSAFISASPYFCLSDFVKNWPTESAPYGTQSTPGRKARFVLMLTNGVDPYNGSTSPLNQDSPYVRSAITDAQRSGVNVSAIYYADAGIRGSRANFSGQSYLAQLTQGTGGQSYYNGTINPVSLSPYLAQFGADIAHTYVATFVAPPSRDTLSLRVKSKAKGLKIRSTEQVRTGQVITSVGQ